MGKRLQVARGRRPLVVTALAAALVLLGAVSGALAAGVFSDVDGDSTHADAVAWALDNGIAAGCGDGEFCPTDPTTRAQMVTFLRNLAEAGVVDAATLDGVTLDGLLSDPDLQGPQGPAGPAGPSGPAGPAGPEGPAGQEPFYSEILFWSQTGLATPHPFTGAWFTLGGYASEDPPGAITVTRPLSADLFPADAEFTMEYVVDVPLGGSLCARLYDVVAGAEVPGSTVCHSDPGPRDPEGDASVILKLEAAATLPTGEPHDLQLQIKDEAAECSGPDGDQEPCYISLLRDARLVVAAG